MKKIVSFVSGVLMCLPVVAQPILNADNKSPLKLKEVIDAYKNNQKQNMVSEVEPENEADEDGVKPVAEGKDYHFDRWLWYWSQHLDQDGNMVSPFKNWEESKKYFNKNVAMGPLAKTTNTNAQWVFEGPDSSGANGKGVGRVNVVSFHPTDSNTYWVGTPGGGAWKTVDNGMHWTCMTDQLPLIAVSDIVFNPLNPNVIYLATGDRDAGDYYSVGVLRSNDGGATWNQTGLQWLTSDIRQANSLVINPQDTSTLTLGASDGIYKSFNGGATWATVGGGNIKQILYNPADTNIMYAASYYKQGFPSQSAQIIRSLDGGMTWNYVSAFTDVFRVALAVSPAAPNVVKAVAASALSGSMYALEGFYSSSDTGHTFTKIFTPCISGTPNLLGSNSSGTDCTYGQGWYDLCIAMSPRDSNYVCVGGINSWFSTNGGTSWSILDRAYSGSSGKVHPDKHWLKFNPLNTNRVFEGNDGGVYWVDNPTSSSLSWNNATNGLGISEFYRMAVSNIASYQVAGAQDVGTKFIQNKKYRDALGGDGMQSQMDWADSSTYYGASQYGNINRIGLTGGATGITPPGQTGGWVTPYIVEPTCHTCLLAAYQGVWESRDRGNSWTAISPSLSGSGDLLRVAATAQDSATIFTLDDNNPFIYYTYDHGANWTTLSTHYSATPSDIKIDPNNKHHIWVTYSGYNTPSIAEYFTDTHVWNGMKYNLPDVPVACVQLDTSNWNLYIGTDIGVFYKDTTMTTWQAYNTGMPSVRVNDLQINYTTGEIWAATYGRSLWKSPKQVNTLGVSVVPFELSSLSVFPNPSHGMFTVKMHGSVKETSAQLRLVDLTGKTVLNASYPIDALGNISVRTNAIPSGTYIIEVSTPDVVLGRNKIVIY